MFNSPFPPLNPNVKYKTAFQRAGFNTNLNEQDNNNNNNSNDDSKLYNVNDSSMMDSPNSTFINDESSSNKIQLINKALQKKQKLLLRKQQEAEEEKTKSQKKSSKKKSPLSKNKVKGISKTAKDTSFSDVNDQNLSNNDKNTKNKILPLGLLFNKNSNNNNNNKDKPIESDLNEKDISPSANNSGLNIKTLNKDLPPIRKGDISHVSDLDNSDDEKEKINPFQPQFLSQNFIELNLNPQPDKEEEEEEKEEEKKEIKEIQEKEDDEKEGMNIDSTHIFEEEIEPPMNTIMNLQDLQFEQESFYSEIQSQDPRAVNGEPSEEKQHFIANQQQEYEINELTPITFSNEQHIPPSGPITKSITNNNDAEEQEGNDDDDRISTVESNEGEDTDDFNFKDNGNVYRSVSNFAGTREDIFFTPTGTIFNNSGSMIHNNETTPSQEQVVENIFKNKRDSVIDTINEPTEELNFGNNSEIEEEEEMEEKNKDDLEFAENGINDTKELNFETDLSQNDNIKNNVINDDEEMSLFRKPYEERHIPPAHLATDNTQTVNTEFYTNEEEQIKEKEELKKEESKDKELKEAEEEELIREEKQVVEENENSQSLPIQQPHSVIVDENVCRGCHNQILPEEKKIYDKNGDLSGKWHKSCFTCTICSTKFSRNTPCYIHNDSPYCETHFFEVTGLICFCCTEKILDDTCLDVPGLGKAHIGCFTCNGCQMPINDEYFSNDTINLCGDCVKDMGKEKMQRRRTVLWDAN